MKMKLQTSFIAIGIALGSALAGPAMAQSVSAAQNLIADDPEVTVDVVSEGYKSTLRADGVLSRQMQVQDEILSLEKERQRAQVINSLVEHLGPDGKITMADGEVIDLSTTNAGREARMKLMQQEQRLLDERVALEVKRVEADLKTDPAILALERQAREAELISSLVEKIGPVGMVTLSDGRMINLAQTDAGKRALIDGLKVDAELAKAQADLAASQNEMHRMTLERQAMDTRRQQEDELARLKLEQERKAIGAGANGETADGQVIEPVRVPVSMTVTQVFGSGQELKAQILVDGSQLIAGVGETIREDVRVKSIEANKVTVDDAGDIRTFFVR